MSIFLPFMADISSGCKYDVVILGAGLAGLTLARQLLMYSGKQVLLLEKSPQLPPIHLKTGESSVHVQGYYLSKTLDLEEHLHRNHFVSYNLRFYWPTRGETNSSYEQYSQSYIRELSNICCYQLDRNKLEAELLRLNLENLRFSLQLGISNLDVALSPGPEPHIVSFKVEDREVNIRATWVVDTSGRDKFLTRKMGLEKTSPIRHASVCFWVEGLLNIENLTELPRDHRLLHQSRRKLGHMPVWLATNHFCGEGYWFWIIPLPGRTSLGLVYDPEQVNEQEVSSSEKVVEWICQRHPLLARDLPKRKIIDSAAYRNFSYDCKQTISAERWALAGEAGRFGDPLYSPGGDLIALYNTLIVDAILIENESTLTIKTRLYELLMWGLYEAYVPSYAVSYDVLSDQECFAMKYAWELSIYFTFYVCPFINQLFTDTSFVVPYLDLFARLGTLNNSLQAFITDYYRWKRARPVEPHEPRFFDFTGLEPLKKSEELLYKTGLSPRECVKALRQAMTNIENLSRFIAVYIHSLVLDNAELLANQQLIKSLDITNLRFDVDAMRCQCQHLDPARDPSLAKLGRDFIRQFHRASRTFVSKSKTSPAPISIADAVKLA
jgi:flavin-dependent dehydrogenase